MTADEIIEHIRQDIDNLIEYVYSLEEYEEMMSELDAYCNKEFTPEDHDAHNILSKFAAADVIRCCNAMGNDASNESWESTYATYAAYRLLLPDLDWAKNCNDPSFLHFINTLQDSVYVKDKQLYNFLMISFFEEHGYYTAAAMYMKHLLAISIDMTMADDIVTSEEECWINILKSYNEELEEKSKMDTVKRGDPISFLNRMPEDEEENNACFKLYYDPELDSSFKLRRMIENRLRIDAPIAFVIMQTGTPYLYQLYQDENNIIYVHSNGDDMSSLLENGSCIGRIVFVERKERWTLYFKKFYLEDHVRPDSYSPYVLGREYYGEIEVAGGNIALIQAESFLNKTELPLFMGKIVNSKIVFFDPKKKYKDMNVIADYDNPFYYYMNAAIRNGQNVFGLITNNIGSQNIKVWVRKLE